MEIERERHIKMLQNNCLKGKHRLRINQYGITWCIICGLLSNSPNAEKIAEGEQLIIK